MNKSSKTHIEKNKILNSALNNASDLGWGPELLAYLKQEHGIVSMARHYPDGLCDLSIAFAEWADTEMLAALTDQQSKGKMKIRDQIAHGVRARLLAIEPHKRAFEQNLKYMMHPARGLKVKKMAWETSDKLWRAAGDTATDYNHYTKRILLSGVFATTTLYWLRDKSENHVKTWDFLDKRIENVLKIGGFLGRLKKSS